MLLDTPDGKEFTDFKYIQRSAEIDVYFAEPYRACHRAINENTNGLLRQYLPKKTDFSTLNDKTLNRYIQKLNNCPRKKLHYPTPPYFLPLVAHLDFESAPVQKMGVSSQFYVSKSSPVENFRSRDKNLPIPNAIN